MRKSEIMMTHRCFDDESIKPSLRIGAFGALQKLEQDHPVRVIYAMIASSLSVNKPSLLHIDLINSPGSDVSSDAISESLIPHLQLHQGLTHQVTIHDPDSVVTRSLADINLPSVAISSPLVVSPINPSQQVAATWGEITSSDVKTRLGVTLSRLSSKLANADIYIQANRGLPFSASAQLVLRLALRRRSAALFNGVQALSNPSWEHWAIPANAAGALDMIEAAGVAISSRDRRLFLEVMSDEFAQQTPVTDNKKKITTSLLVPPAYMRLVRSIDKHIQQLVDRQAAKMETSDLYNPQNWISDLHSRPKLDSFEGTLAARSSIDLLSSKPYLYRRIHTNGDLSSPQSVQSEQLEEQPMFSF